MRNGATMTRSKFYVVTVAMCVISAVQIALTDNKAQIDYQTHCLVSTVFAYAIWHDWDWFPKSWWRKNKDSK